jgi:hypothetical protein
VYAGGAFSLSDRQADERALLQVRQGRLGTVVIGGREYSFDLTGADEALIALRECMAKFSHLPYDGTL